MSEHYDYTILRIEKTLGSLSPILTIPQLIKLFLKNSQILKNISTLCYNSS
jgi:hypothetical protein